MPVQEATAAELVDVVDVAPPPKVRVNSTSEVTGHAASKAPWPISRSVPSGQVRLVRLMVCSTGGGSWPASGRLVGSAGGNLGGRFLDTLAAGLVEDRSCRALLRQLGILRNDVRAFACRLDSLGALGTLLGDLLE